MKLEQTELPLETLLLDPNNYRFQDGHGFVFASERRFHEDTVQEKTLARLKAEKTLERLKASIEHNGFIPVERIVVRPYADEQGKYVVVEGNRRVAALKWAKEEHEAGVEKPVRVVDVFSAVPVVITPAEMPPGFYESLMGVRHVGGIKEWGGYQSARLVATLRDEHKLAAQETADRLGMTVHEVNRRYRAYKALQQMERSEEYGDSASGDLYPLFHEAVGAPAVREWLGWNERTFEFEDEDGLEQFYELIAPQPREDDDNPAPVLATYGDVRKLKVILPDDDARAALLDPDDGDLDSAIHILKTKHESGRGTWRSKTEAANQAMDRMGIAEMESLTDEDVGLIQTLRATAKKILDYNAARKKD